MEEDPTVGVHSALGYFVRVRICCLKPKVPLCLDLDSNKMRGSLTKVSSILGIRQRQAYRADVLRNGHRCVRWPCQLLQLACLSPFRYLGRFPNYDDISRGKILVHPPCFMQVVQRWVGDVSEVANSPKLLTYHPPLDECT